MTNPAPGQPPAPHPPGSAWPQEGAPQQPAQQLGAHQQPAQQQTAQQQTAQQQTALLPAAQPHAPHETAENEPAQQAPDDATIRLPRVQPGPLQAQLMPPQQAAFNPPPFPQGTQQRWPQGPGYPPGAPGQYGAVPPSRKPKRILIGVIAAVVVLGVLVTGVVLTMQQAAEPPAAPDVAASPLDGLAPDTEPPGSGLPGGGGNEAVLEELSTSLQANLNDRDVDGLLETVCEDGKVDDAARNDLAALPFLDPASSQFSDPIDFPEGSVSPNDGEDDGSFLIDFSGSYTSTDEPIHLTFKAFVYPDGSGAVWCGVA